jgi:hypothetical protein
VTTGADGTRIACVPLGCSDERATDAFRSERQALAPR